MDVFPQQYKEKLGIYRSINFLHLGIQPRNGSLSTMHQLWFSGKLLIRKYTEWFHIFGFPVASLVEAGKHFKK
jgi:hypothetical protein